MKKVLIALLVLVTGGAHASLIIDSTNSWDQTNSNVTVKTITGVSVGDVIVAVAGGNNSVLADGFVESSGFVWTTEFAKNVGGAGRNTAYWYGTATSTSDITLTYTPGSSGNLGMGLFKLHSDTGADILLLDIATTTGTSNVTTKDVVYDFGSSNSGADYTTGVFLEGIAAGGVLTAPLSTNVANANNADKFLAQYQSFSGIDGSTRTFTMNASQKLSVSGLAFGEAIAVPEPSTSSILGLGAIMMLLRRRRRRRRSA